MARLSITRAGGGLTRETSEGTEEGFSASQREMASNGAATCHFIR